MSDTATNTVTVSRPGFADYTLNYHNSSVEDFHRLQKALAMALFSLGDEYVGTGTTTKSK